MNEDKKPETEELWSLDDFMRESSSVANLPTKIVEVDLGNGRIRKLKIRACTSGDQSAAETAAAKIDPKTSVRWVDDKERNAHLIARVCLQPKIGPKQARMLMNWPLGAVTKLYVELLALSGMGDEVAAKLGQAAMGGQTAEEAMEAEDAGFTTPPEGGSETSATP